MSTKRRIVGVVAIILLVAAAYVVGALIGGPADKGDSERACKETVVQYQQFAAALDDLQSTVPTTSVQGGSGDRIRGLEKVFAGVERQAILVEQNPTCFDPGTRATVEANYRQWKASFG